MPTDTKPNSQILYSTILTESSNRESSRCLVAPALYSTLSPALSKPLILKLSIPPTWSMHPGGDNSPHYRITLVATVGFRPISPAQSKKHVVKISIVASSTKFTQPGNNARAESDTLSPASSLFNSIDKELVP